MPPGRWLLAYFVDPDTLSDAHGTTTQCQEQTRMKKAQRFFVEKWAVLLSSGNGCESKGMFRDNTAVVSDLLNDAGGHHAFSQPFGARTPPLEAKYSLLQETICGKHNKRLCGRKCVD